MAELITSRAVDRLIPMTLGMRGADSMMVVVDGNRPASLCPVLPLTSLGTQSSHETFTTA